MPSAVVFPLDSVPRETQVTTMASRTAMDVADDSGLGSIAPAVPLYSILILHCKCFALISLDPTSLQWLLCPK
jgi:hypothetical protein